MKEQDLEKKLCLLPLKKIKTEFKEQLLGRLRSEFAKTTIKQESLPKGKLVFILNSVLLVLIFISILLFGPFLTNIKSHHKKIDPSLLEIGKQFYPPSALSFRLSFLESGEYNLISLKEARHEYLEK